MHGLTPRRLGVLVAFLIAISVPAIALAAPVSLEGSEIWVQIWPEGEPNTNVIIVGVELPADTTLPATVRLPVPDGATVFWAGEILGPDPSTDIQREFQLVKGEGGMAAEFTVETTRSVQFDATYGAIEIDGNDLISKFEWRQTVPSATTAFAVRTPVGTGDVTIEPAPPTDPRENESGERLYTLNTAQLQPGATYPIKITYRRAGVTDLEANSSETLLWILGGLLGAAVLALVVAVLAQRRRSGDVGPVA
ncbi:hypothetical protein EG835_00255 [bacterium]|nr:hypothetical protein [bacterium]